MITVKGNSTMGAKITFDFPSASRPGSGMQLLVISGFLGTGKTTFIIELAKAALKKRINVAIVVNEIGEIGVDDMYMRKLGLNVREILGGCICCTLAGSLQETLDALAREYGPELVILEPSGVADLETVDRALQIGPENPCCQVTKVTLVDPLRLEMMMTVMTPLVTSQIRCAQWVVTNKQDAASAEEMAYARHIVRTIKSRCADHDPFGQNRFRRYRDRGIDFMTELIFEPYTVSLRFHSQTTKAADTWAQILCDFMNHIAGQIAGQDTVMIGHLKGIARTTGSGFFKISAVRAGHSADISGDLNWRSDELVLTLNLLVFGMTAGALAELTRALVAADSKPWTSLATLGQSP